MARPSVFLLNLSSNCLVSNQEMDQSMSVDEQLTSIEERTLSIIHDLFTLDDWYFLDVSLTMNNNMDMRIVDFLECHEGY